MADAVATVGSEFQSLPLEFIVSAPLTAAVQAQAAAALATKSFLESVTGKQVEFEASSTKGAVPGSAKKISVPLLACIPVPHLRIDSITTHFKFEITQTIKDSSRTNVQADGTAGLAQAVPLVNLSLKGSLTHESSREATTNKSGMIEITVHASEAAIPSGLQKVLDWVTSTISLPEPPAAQ